MVKRYTKKPVTIEAVKWDGLNTHLVLEFMGQKVTVTDSVSGHKFYDFCEQAREHGLTINTLEDGKDLRAKHVASVGDYIIKGVAGEFYPCKPNIFEQTYSTGESDYATLEQERDGLKAMVEELRGRLRAAYVFNEIDEIETVYLLNKTPSQCLAEVEARAVEKALDHCAFDGRIELTTLDEYIKQLREKAK